MTGPRNALRYAGLALALALVLAACTPATLSTFFAPCPEPNPEGWAAGEEERSAPLQINAPSIADEPGETR